LVLYSRHGVWPTGRAPLEPGRWWAHLVGAPRVPRINIAPTILPKKIEDLREVAALMSIAS